MKEPKKIAYVGGPDLSLRIPFIKALASNGYDIIALGSDKVEENKFGKHSIPYQLYSLNRRFNPINEIKALFTLRNIFKREKFIIVHAFDTKPTILARIAAAWAGIPIIIGTIPGLGSLFSEENLLNKILRKIYIFAQMIACKVSNMTIFQNQDDRDFFISRRITDISKAIIIKGSGIDTKRFSSENANAKDVQKTKKELCLKNDLVISMIARLVKYKGVKEYLEAASLLKNKYPKISFLLVGPQDETLAAFSLKEVSKYSKIVKYLGPRNDIQEILFLSDIVVLPSYYREGIPRVLLEAASMEKPIVTTNLPGCKEIVEDGKNGFLIPPKNVNALAEAIEKFILNKGLRKEMGILSRRKAIKEFSLAIVFKETQNLYSGLLKSARH